MRVLSSLCLLISVLCLLAACGFHPVYGSHDDNGNPVAATLNQIAIENIPDRQGQILRNDLIDRLYGKGGRPQQPAYHLAVTLRNSQEDLGIQANATSTRTLMNMSATYVLTDTTGKKILDGKAHSVASFNSISDQYATLAARDSAFERTINEVSEQIVNRLSLYFSEHPATK